MTRVCKLSRCSFSVCLSSHLANFHLRGGVGEGEPGGPQSEETWGESRTRKEELRNMAFTRESLNQLNGELPNEGRPFVELGVGQSDRDVGSWGRAGGAESMGSEGHSWRLSGNWLPGNRMASFLFLFF